MFVQIQFPQRLVADNVLRQAVSALRLINGAGANVMPATNLIRDLRVVLTASPVGTINSARGVCSACTIGDPLTALQHASMLLYHPLELIRVARRFLPDVETRQHAALPVSMKSIAASLWLIWILCTCIISLRALNCTATTDAERSMLKLRLGKLALDMPLALHFLLGSSLLPLAAVGGIGIISSFLGIRGALADPAKPVAPRVTLPMPLFALSRLPPSLRMRWCTPIWWKCTRLCSSRLKRIGGGPLTKSCKWSFALSDRTPDKGCSKVATGCARLATPKCIKRVQRSRSCEW